MYKSEFSRETGPGGSVSVSTSYKYLYLYLDLCFIYTYTIPIPLSLPPIYIYIHTHIIHACYIYNIIHACMRVYIYIIHIYTYIYNTHIQFISRNWLTTVGAVKSEVCRAGRQAGNSVLRQSLSSESQFCSQALSIDWIKGPLTTLEDNLLYLESTDCKCSLHPQKIHSHNTLDEHLIE